jgi:hypothetical protein
LETCSAGSSSSSSSRVPRIVSLLLLHLLLLLQQEEPALLVSKEITEGSKMETEMEAERGGRKMEASVFAPLAAAAATRPQFRWCNTALV